MYTPLWVNVMFVSLIAAAAIGLWFNLPPLAMLFLTVMALAMWDIARFEQRLAQVDSYDSTLRWQHGRHLMAVCGVGLGIGSMAYFLPRSLNFWMSLAVGLTLALTLSGVVMWLRRQYR